MRKSVFSILLVLFTLVVSKAQGVTINEEPTITKMMAAYTGINKVTTSTQMIDGFRIQLMATTDRRKVDQVMSSFSAIYQGVPVTWSQAQPYYRIRVGAFAQRDGAAKYLQTIKKDYPDAYIVTDKVSVAEVMN
jgi:SPOR domain